MLNKKDYYITSNHNLEKSEKKSSFISIGDNQINHSGDISSKKFDTTIKKMEYKDLFAKLIEIIPEKSKEISE